MALKFGLDVATLGEGAHPRVMAELAREAEDAGWDGFFIFDVLVGGQTPPQPVLDPWVTLAAVAMTTERIRLGALVTPLARRRPWQVARETVTLDQLSNGRLVVGVGLGDIGPDAFDRVGEEPDPRARATLLDEGLEVLTGLWRGEPFTHAGDRYQLRDVTFLPMPMQQPRIPIWVAGYWPNKRPLRRAARWDGIVAGPVPGPLTPAVIRELLAYVGEHRDATTPFDVVVESNDPADPATRTPEALAAWEAAGVTWWIEGIWDDKWRDIDAIRAQIRRGPPRL